MSKMRFVLRAGARNQPLVQLQRKSLQLQSSHNYTALSAALTTARTQYEIGGFPFLLGQETNSSGRCPSQKPESSAREDFAISGLSVLGSAGQANVRPTDT